MTYVALLVARCTSGFVLSRSVGWAYPSLFSHTALYEPIVGIGPLLVGTVLFDDVRDKRHMLGRLVVLASFALLDGTPWSYMCGVGIAGVHRLAQGVLAQAQESGYALLPQPTSSESKGQGSGTQTLQLTRTRILVVSVLGILASALAGNVFDTLRSLRSSVDAASAPGVHIVMLTIPRTRDLASDVMIESITSYAEPWLAQLSAGIPSNSMLTVFAHLGQDGTHPGFERAKIHFAASAVPIRFYTQPMEPNGLVMNHHVHLADAMEYAYERGYEWTMFVEDDFALCGQWGWENLLRVLLRLGDPTQTALNGAFIGTGGRYVLTRIVLRSMF